MNYRKKCDLFNMYVKARMVSKYPLIFYEIILKITKMENLTLKK